MDRLAEDRMETHENLERTSQIFLDHRENAEADMAILTRNNRWKEKLIAARVLFQNLEILGDISKQRAVDELKHYFAFEKHCSATLKTYSTLLLKLGQRRQRDTLRTWYDNTLKPLATISQTQDLASRVYRKRLLALTFFSWSHYHLERMNSYRSKSNSISLIWFKMCQTSKVEVKRSLKIWRESPQHTSSA